MCSTQFTNKIYSFLVNSIHTIYSPRKLDFCQALVSIDNLYSTCIHRQLIFKYNLTRVTISQSANSFPNKFIVIEFDI